jgi:DNA-binding transcriptional ArsR family regulator
LRFIDLNLCPKSYNFCSLFLVTGLFLHYKYYFQKYLQINTFNRNIAIYFKDMGLAKIEEFTAKENKIAQYAKALAHPARVSIILILLKKQSCICGDIVDELPLSQSTVSQHLKELKSAGLIKGEIEGVKTCYCIDEKEWKQAQHYLGTLLNSTVGTNCC